MTLAAIEQANASTSGQASLDTAEGQGSLTGTGSQATVPVTPGDPTPNSESTVLRPENPHRDGLTVVKTPPPNISAGALEGEVAAKPSSGTTPNVSAQGAVSVVESSVPQVPSIARQRIRSGSQDFLSRVLINYPLVSHMIMASLVGLGGLLTFSEFVLGPLRDQYVYNTDLANRRAKEAAEIVDRLRTEALKAQAKKPLGLTFDEITIYSNSGGTAESSRGMTQRVSSAQENSNSLKPIDQVRQKLEGLGFDIFGPIEISGTSVKIKKAKLTPTKMVAFDPQSGATLTAFGGVTEWSDKALIGSFEIAKDGTLSYVFDVSRDKTLTVRRTRSQIEYQYAPAMDDLLNILKTLPSRTAGKPSRGRQRVP